MSFFSNFGKQTQTVILDMEKGQDGTFFVANVSKVQTNHVTDMGNYADSINADNYNDALADMKSNSDAGQFSYDYKPGHDYQGNVPGNIR